MKWFGLAILASLVANNLQTTFWRQYNLGKQCARDRRDRQLGLCAPAGKKKKLTENLGLAPRSLLLYLSFSFLSVFPSHFWHFK
jgi:hypothetical protein